MTMLYGLQAYTEKVKRRFSTCWPGKPLHILNQNLAVMTNSARSTDPHNLVKYRMKDGAAKRYLGVVSFVPSFSFIPFPGPSRALEATCFVQTRALLGFGV